MRVRARSVVLGVLGLLVLLVAGGLTVVGWQVVLGPSARPLTARTFEKTPARLARGQYLVEGVAACFHCHSDHDFTTPEYGSATQVWAAVSPELDDRGGEYLESCRVSDAVAPYANDAQHAAEFWDLSEKLCATT